MSPPPPVGDGPTRSTPDVAPTRVPDVDPTSGAPRGADAEVAGTAELDRLALADRPAAIAELDLADRPAAFADLDAAIVAELTAIEES